MEDTLEKQKIVNEIKQVTAECQENYDKKELMDRAQARDLAGFADTQTEEGAKIIAAVLAKKYPGVLFDALKDRMETIDNVVSTFKKEIKGV